MRSLSSDRCHEGVDGLLDAIPAADHDTAHAIVMASLSCVLRRAASAPTPSGRDDNAPACPPVRTGLARCQYCSDAAAASDYAPRVSPLSWVGHIAVPVHGHHSEAHELEELMNEWDAVHGVHSGANRNLHTQQSTRLEAMCVLLWPAAAGKGVGDCLPPVSCARL